MGEKGDGLEGKGRRGGEEGRSGSTREPKGLEAKISVEGGGIVEEGKDKEGEGGYLEGIGKRAEEEGDM